MPASSAHPSYTKYLPRWRLTRDAVEGSAEVKSGKQKYLPKPNKDEISAENDTRYTDYVDRASFVGFTSSTLEGMLGMVFRKPLVVEMQQAIAYLENNADGGGLTLDQMARGVIGDILQTGRYGFLVDYPQAEQGMSRADVLSAGFRANILTYKSESIINWRTEVVGSIKRYAMIVLEEIRQIRSEDGFTFEEKAYHRVLTFIDGLYVQIVYDDKDEPVELIEPKKADGSRWTIIPFAFVGSKNNDEEIDKAPLYDIADINIGHYRNSADFEESSFMVGQPTPYVNGLTQSWVDANMKSGVILGSRRFLLLGEGASAGLMQADANGMPERGMEMKEAQMVKIGARIIQDVTGNETAEAAKIRFAGQNSKLGTIVGNVEAALLQCFGWALEFMGGEGDNLIEINKEFYNPSVDPQLVIARIQLLDRGVIAKSDLQDKLRTEGEIAKERTNEQIDSEAEEKVLF